MDSLSGTLLVATPHAGGDLFTRGVVLLLHHDMDGAYGVLLNKPLPADVSDVLPPWQPHLSRPGRLFQGGPVGLDTALGLASVPGDREVDGVVPLFGSVGVVDLDHEAAAIGASVSGLRVFAGYAGWIAGQLETEIAADAWYTLEAEVGDVFTCEPGQLWVDVLARQRGPLAWAANFPTDPMMN